MAGRERWFTRWEGGECPISGYNLAEAILGNGEISTVSRANNWGKIAKYPQREIIAYRVLPPKQQGEIWAVVWKTQFNMQSANGIELSFRSSLQNAIAFARGMGCGKPLAIFNPYQTDGEWVEGQGLELMED